MCEKPLLSRLEALALLPFLKAVQEILFKANFSCPLEETFETIKGKNKEKAHKKNETKHNTLKLKDKLLFGSKCQIILYPVCG